MFYSWSSILLGIPTGLFLIFVIYKIHQTFSSNSELGRYTNYPHVECNHSLRLSKRKNGIYRYVYCEQKGCDFHKKVIQDLDDNFECCSVCEGYGFIPPKYDAYGRVKQESESCDVCNGAGKILTLRARIDRIEDKVNFEITK